MLYEPNRPGKLSAWSTLRLAWRNLTRNRRRTWITAVTVSVAVLLLQVQTAVLIGFEQQSFDNLINYQTGHAKLFATGYYEEREVLPLDYTLVDPEGLARRVQQVQGVAAATPRLVFSAMLSDGMDQVPVLGTGIDLETSDTDVFRLPQAIVQGRFLKQGDDGMLIGSGLARFFNVQTGDALTVLAKTQAGAYEALDLTVVGILGTGNPALDENSFVISLAAARNMLEMQGKATELAVRYETGAREYAVLQRIERDFADKLNLEVKSWQEVEDSFMALVQAKRSGRLVMMGVLMLIAIVGIANTILMATFERTREIGTLMAMGLRGSSVRSLFLVEGALVGFLGGAVGTALALVIIFYFAANGIDLSAFSGQVDIGYPVKDMLYLVIPTSDILFIWTLTGALAAVAALYPAIRASRLDPAEAIRYV